MSSKKWLGMFAAAVALALALCAGFNVLVDPFGVFGDPILDWYSYNETNNPRAAKIAWLKEHSGEFDSYVIGSSSAASYNVEKLNQYMDARFYNLFVYGCDTGDYVDFAAWLLEHCEVKNLILNLGLNEANTDSAAASEGLNDQMHAEADGGNRLWFYLQYAFCNPKYSVDKLTAHAADTELPQVFDVFDVPSGCYDKRLRDVEKIGDMDVYMADHGGSFAAAPGEAELPYIEQCAQAVGEIRAMCQSAGVNLIVIASPVYTGQWGQYSEATLRAYKTAIARETDYWDFSYTPISFDSRYFYDETHFRNAVGEMVLAEIFGDDSVYRPEGFGTYVTADNCGEWLDGLFANPPQADMADYTVDLPVLMYHHVVEEAGGELGDTVITAATLERHLAALAGAGYHTISIQDMVDYVYHGGELPENPVLLTFDDGYYSNYEVAMPLLEKYGMEGVVFAIGTSVGHTQYKDTQYDITPHFGWDEAREMVASGILDIQSHTYDMHQWPDYESGEGILRQTALPREGEGEADYIAALRADLERYSQERERELGEGFTALSYPSGGYWDITEVIVHQSGIPVTFAANAYRRNVIVRGLPQSLYALCRWNITEEVTEEGILYILRGS